MRRIVKYQLKDYDSAILDFSKTVDLESTNADAFYWRALSKTELKKFSDAIADCDKAIKLKPQDATYYFERGKLKLILKTLMMHVMIIASIKHLEVNPTKYP